MTAIHHAYSYMVSTKLLFLLRFLITVFHKLNFGIIMANNRDLLKEAIADAKSVKETAIANAKLALEEAFTPYLQDQLSAKLQEMDDEDDKDVRRRRRSKRNGCS